MRVFGITAEYNPFHNGHKYQIEKARKLGATHIVCIMSGTAVQRGDIAVYSKYERARAAISCGADLVVELPCPFSCSNAEIFARSAVSLMAALGENAVTDICFGCETDDIEKLRSSAELSEKLKDSAEVRKLLSAGISYPAALSKAGGEHGAVFRGANDLLAVEYIKAAKEFVPQINFVPIKRIGAAHDSDSLSDIPSATFIRNKISKGEAPYTLLPFDVNESPCFLKNADRAVLYKLVTANRDEVRMLPDMTENLLNRYFKAVYSGVKSLSGFADQIKSKNITMARVRRMLMHLVLGVKSDDIKLPPYGRILALNQRGRDILSLSKEKAVPFGTSLKRLENTSDYALRVSQLEQNAVRLQDLCRKDLTGFSNEYTAKLFFQATK